MQPSIVGLLVAGAIFFLDRRLQGGLVVGLLISLAFGATAFAVLTSLGGSSPLIYTLFAMLLALSLLGRKDLFGKIAAVFRAHPIAWIIIPLTIYVIGGAILLPRLFAGEVNVMIVQRGIDGTGGVHPAHLRPHSTNVTQAAYFSLAALIYFVVLAVALDKGGLRRMRLAVIAWAVTILVTGYVDLLGKLTGLGDVWAFLRTANYTMMTGESHAIAGLPRINGAFSEASAFAAAGVPAFLFAFCYWRISRDWLALALATGLFVLVILSTSTTAYATLGICAAWFCFGAAVRFLQARILLVDAFVLSLGILALAVILTLYLYDEGLFAPFFDMFEMMVLEKAGSSSAIERGHWNLQAWQAFLDTKGLGIGIGSTRTSSWLVAVVSNLGLLGSIGMAATLAVLIYGLAGTSRLNQEPSVTATADGCRAAALASIVAASLTSASPDPGVFYFFALAVIVATRHRRKIETAPVFAAIDPSASRLRRAGLNS